MKIRAISATIACLISLSACGDAPVDSKTPEAIKAKAESIHSKSSADLSKMDIPEIIEFVDGEAKDMTALLKTVTDESSAEAAVSEIRTIVPRLNAALQSLENADIENMKLSIGNMRKMMKVAQSQAGLVNEVMRISEIPEARAVLQKEIDKIELPNN